MRTKSLLFIFILVLVGALVVGLVSATGDGPTAKRAADLSPNGAESQPLSMFVNLEEQVDDDLYASAIIHLSPIVKEPQSGTMLRILAGTINWQCGADLLGTSYFHLEASPLSTEALETDITISYAGVTPTPPQSGVAGQYGAIIQPRPGLTWGQVDSRDDVTMEVGLLAPR